jgi:hypothetical protein
MKLYLALNLVLLPFITFSQGNPRYLAKSIDNRDIVFCYPFYDGSYFSLGYGFNQQQIALKAQNLVLGRYLSQYRSELEYRTPFSGNRYVDIKVRRSLPLRMNNMYQPFSATAGYKRIKSNHEKTTEQFFVGPTFRTNGLFVITPAYSVQQHQIADGSIQNSNGITLALFKSLWDELIIDASTTYWFNQWQYSFRLRQDLKRAIFIGASWERVNEWWEAGMEVGVRM